MLIGLLLIAFLTMWGIAFVLFERDLACPTMLLLSGYTLSVAVAFFSDFKIPFVYHSQTVFVLIVGTLLFCIPAYAIKTCYAGGKGVHPDLPRSVIDIRSLALLLYAAGLLGTIIALSFWVYRDILAEIKPTLTYAESVNAMRNYLIANPDGVKIPELFLLNQIKKVFRIAGYFLLVIWARNAVVRRSFVKDKLLFLNLILTVILFGTEGGRTGIVAYVLAGVALCFFFNRLYNNTRITISGALVVKALGVFLVASVAFYAMLYLSGRQSGALHIGALIHHVQFYLGGSIPLLDNFLLTSLGVGGGTEIIGKETFYSLVQLMSKLHITDIPLYSVHLEFRPGVYDGNVYTGFRSYIHDFGYAGLIVLPVLFSVCANWLYYAAVQASREKALAVGLVLYATLMYPIFADFVRCFFFLSFFSINTLCLCLGVILLQLFLLKTGWMRFSPVTSKARSSRSR